MAPCPHRSPARARRGSAPARPSPRTPVHSPALSPALSPTPAEAGGAAPVVRQGPLYKLTVGLVATYQRINEHYFEASRTPSASDDNGHDLRVRRGARLGGMEVLAPLGRGAFGQVLRCRTADGREVAVKVVKNVPAFRRQAQSEADILREILHEDPRGDFGIVALEGTFEHEGHLCLVLELLSHSLYDLLRAGGFRGLPLPLVRRLAYQVLTSLYFLAEGVDIIHCDLKPENILLRSAKKSGIKLVDFGSACRREQQVFKYVQSRFYRAPEVILELPYAQPIDMWSLGCILVELFTGEPLLPGADEADQLHKMREVLGPVPEHMVRASPKMGTFFVFRGGSFSLRTELLRPAECRTLEGVVRARASQACIGEYLHFVDLVKAMLAYDPAQRIEPMDALHHPFFAPILSRAAPQAAAGEAGTAPQHAGPRHASQHAVEEYPAQQQGSRAAGQAFFTEAGRTRAGSAATP